MKQFTSETVIISKEAWKYLRNVDRQRDGRAPLNDERLNAIWDRISFHNGGANPATHPIRKNEHRVDKDTFSMSISAVKSILDEKGFTYRQDGYIVEGIYM
jgi:hypothetical protein